MTQRFTTKDMNKALAKIEQWSKENTSTELPKLDYDRDTECWTVVREKEA